jgi:hypothetical protein
MLNIREQWSYKAWGGGGKTYKEQFIQSKYVMKVFLLEEFCG